MASEQVNVLVTGASGFLGSNVLKAFAVRPDVRLIAACRDRSILPDNFQGEIREGDLRDTDYVKALVREVDVICHTGTWAAMWNHVKQERENFFLPAIHLIEEALQAGVARFIMTSTVAITRPAAAGHKVSDFDQACYTGFWPHIDRLVDIDTYMKEHAQGGMKMISLRLGHFVGAGNKLGIVPALLPRLKTHLVPWLSGGKARLPLIADSDLGHSFVAAAFAQDLQDYESFNICNAAFPSTREVIDYIAGQTGLSRPFFSVPYPMAYLFGYVMEILHPVLPGSAPFLTRSIVHLAEDWYCDTDYAKNKLGFVAQKDWKVALDEALSELRTHNYPWQALAQK